MAKNRKYFGSLKANRISPKITNPKRKTIDDLKSVGIVVTKIQAKKMISHLIDAIHLSSADKINVTGYRKTNQVTITSQ